MKLPLKFFRNKYTLIACATVLLQILIFLVSPIINLHDTGNNMLLALAPIVLQVFWLILIAIDSKIFRTVWAYVLLFCFSPYLLGLLGKFEHYSWAGIALINGAVSVSIAYALRFILKKRKSRLDWVKVIFILGYSLLSILLLEHLIPQYFYDLRVLLFYVLIFTFAFNKDKKVEDEPEQFSFEENGKK